MKITMILVGAILLARFDMNKGQAIASRKSIMELAKKEGWTMFGMHFSAE